METQEAQQQDIPKLVDLLCHAFASDPFYTWAFPDQNELPHYFEKTLHTAIQANQVVTTKGLLGVAIWHAQTPLSTPQSPASESLSRLASAALQLDRLRPPVVHSYLPILATATTARQQGVGRLLVDCPPVHHQQAPVYLEATTQQSVAFYAKVGFAAIQSIPLSAELTVWGMQR